VASDEMGRTITCHDVGMGGNCGCDCPVYREGDCDSPPEPYVWICVDDVGMNLTKEKSYPQVCKDAEFLTVMDDEGIEREFFLSRFDLAEQEVANA